MNNDSAMCAPVLLLNFNRPDFTERQINALRPVQPSKVFFAVDGPRENRPEEMQRVLKVRELVSAIDWPCEVKTLFREKNLGCKYGVSGAITWFFENVEEGIILEDDVVPSFEFFSFATSLLEKYRHDDRIGAISGFNRYDYQTDKTVSYQFSYHLEIWGWASWRRAWKCYEIDMKSYLPAKEKLVDRYFLTPRVKQAFLSGVNAVENGLQTWDYQLSLAFLAHGYLNIIPRCKLSGNAGVGDENATNTGGYNFDAHHFLALGSVGPLVHPSRVEQDDDAVRADELRTFGVVPRGLSFLGGRGKWLARFCDSAGRLLERFVPFIFKW